MGNFVQRREHQDEHVKPRNEGESGSIIQREFPIHHSNVMHYSAAEKKRSRVGKKMEGDKKCAC